MSSAPSQEEIEQERLKLWQIIMNWELDDVFNCDESALYWSREPSRVLAQSRLSGKKLSKERVTIFLATNATGSEKLPLVFINKSKSPRSLKGVNHQNLPVDYYWSSTAWMQVA